MKVKRQMWLGIAALMTCLLCVYGGAFTMQKSEPLVRIAELEIDPAQPERYKAALKEEIETSIRVEPVVLSLYAETPHFKTYKVGTQAMMKSLKLVETTPILLGAKTKSRKRLL